MKNITCLALAVLASAALTSNTRADVTFTSGDVVGGSIQYDYNALDDDSYINGASTGLTFADQATTTDVQQTTDPAGYLEGTNGAPGQSTFVLEFQAPTGDVFSSLDLTTRLVAFYGYPTDNVQLAISTNGTNYTMFDELAGNGTGTIHDTTNTYDLSSDVAGSGTFYIEGTFNDGSSPTSYLQMFRTSTSGDSGSEFLSTVGVEAASVPEPSTVGFLLVAGVMAASVAILRRKKVKA